MDNCEMKDDRKSSMVAGPKAMYCTAARLIVKSLSKVETKGEKHVQKIKERVGALVACLCKARQVGFLYDEREAMYSTGTVARHQRVGAS
jgi:hypothetical protein